MLDRGRCAGLRLETEPQVSWQALVAVQQLWEEALEPREALGQSASKSLAGDAYAKCQEKIDDTPSQSVRPGFRAAAVERAPSGDPTADHSAVNPVIDQLRGPRTSAHPERAVR